MQIYSNGFIDIQYEPSTDTLSFIMPDVDNILMPEMARSLTVIVEHVRNYDVKRVLVDARGTNIWESGAAYGRVIADFYRDLARTRARKVARLVTPESPREAVVKGLIEKMMLSVEVQAFTEASTATQWLTSSD